MRFNDEQFKPNFGDMTSPTKQTIEERVSNGC